MTQTYEQSPKGKFILAEAMEVMNSLDGESKEYFEETAEAFRARMKLGGIKDFGIESAREFLATAIFKGWFVPKVWRNADGTSKNPVNPFMAGGLVKFVWRCRSCKAEYPQDANLPKYTNPLGFEGVKCQCGEVVDLYPIGAR
jgi:hypothetical protein